MSGLPLFLFLTWSGLTLNVAFAAPNTPSTPQVELAKKAPENPFRCDRLIRFKGRTLPCDSALRRDGESLRSIFEKTPTALDELDSYQSGRTAIKYSAYTGTAGLVLTLASGFFSNLLISDPDETRSAERSELAKKIRMAGLGITVGGVVYGYSHLRSNEDHLRQAILNFNTAHPDHPVEILFKSEF